MAKYALDKLNDKELEELARDILQLELKVRFETFRRGKDKGIDLRYSTDSETNSIIVQVKHYQRSGYKLLLSILKKEELPKVKKLAPMRYILVTSVPLNVSEKAEILELFTNFIHSTMDIFGADDIENSVSRFPQVLRSHPKLFLTSLEILSEVMNAHIHSRSADRIRIIQSKLHLFVPNEKYKEAIKILNDEHFLIITGEPGIGKTSLADFITFQHLADSFRFIYILSDLEDAEKMMLNEEKMLFYFDDFLGSNYLKIKHNPHQDAALLDLISRIKLSKNKRLILTTRTTILTQARSDFEKLKNPIIDISRHEIHISDYTDIQKAHILYNHIFHSQLGSDFVTNFINKKSYQSIIYHPNYSPRLIEYIVDNTRLTGVNPENYHEYLVSKLEKPKDIWLDPYESQIDDASKFLLQTLLTFPSYAAEQQVHDAFNERINYEVRVHGYTRPSNLYQFVLHSLLGGFIHRRMGNRGPYLEFYNPSFGDFLTEYLSNNHEDVLRILNSLLYTDQFREAFEFDDSTPDLLSESLKNSLFGNVIFRIPDKIKLSRKLVLPIIKSRLEFLKPLDINKSRALSLCSFLITNFELEEVDNELSSIYPGLDFNSIPRNQFEDLIKILDILHYPDLKSNSFVKRDFETIVLALFHICSYEEDFRRILNLFKEHLYDYSSFRHKHGYILQNIIDSFWRSGEIDSRIENDNFSDIFEKDKMLEKLKEIEEDVKKLNEELFLEESPAFKEIYDWDFNAIIRENVDSIESENYEAPYLEEKVENKTKSNNEFIEDLFDNLISIKSKIPSEDI